MFIIQTLTVSGITFFQGFVEFFSNCLDATHRFLWNAPKIKWPSLQKLLYFYTVIPRHLVQSRSDYRPCGYRHHLNTGQKMVWYSNGLGSHLVLPLEYQTIHKFRTRPVFKSPLFCTKRLPKMPQMAKKYPNLN